MWSINCDYFYEGVKRISSLFIFAIYSFLLVRVPKEVLGIFYSRFQQFIVISVPNQLLSSALVSTVSVYSSSVCGLICGQRKSFGQNP